MVNEKLKKEIKEIAEKNKIVLIKYTCVSCGNFKKIPIGESLDKCECKAFNWRVDYDEEEYKTALEKFRDKRLFELIKLELDKGHIEDNNLKMTNFLVMDSGLSKNPKRRQSQAITGYSSEGKNNLIENNLKHMPRDSTLYVSNATQPAIEEDIKTKNIICFKEINFAKEDGANKHLLEVLKQVTEGGTASLKKDITKGFRESRFDVNEQKTVIYPTIEAERDEEAETRFIFGAVSSSYDKIKKVNDNTLDSFSDLSKLADDSEQKDSWIRIGLTSFYYNSDFEVYLPYARFLKEQINGQDIFDHNSPRSQRDIKRLLSLTCATAYLFQLQRKIIEFKGKKYLISKPEDFINTLKVSADFFNQTYTGLDPRLTDVLKIMSELGQEWTPRDYIQDKLHVSRNTIKSYCDKLSENGLIEGTTGKELNLKEGGDIYNGNKAYYKRCQNGVKKQLIRCQISELKSFLEKKTKKIIKNTDTFLTPSLKGLTPFKNDDFDIIGSKVPENKEIKKGVNKLGGICDISNKTSNSGKIDTFSLTPFKKEEIEKAAPEFKELLELPDLNENETKN